jgi:predicted transcriptional regulator
MSVRMGGGWQGEGYPEHMSDSMIRRLEQARLDEEREALRAEAVKEVMAQDWATRNAIAAGELAAERGEYFTPREVMSGLAGRTKEEAIAWHSALMDRQDAEQRARLRRMGYRDELTISEDWAADTSAPHPDDLARDAETLARVGRVVPGGGRSRRSRGRWTPCGRVGRRLSGSGWPRPCFGRWATDADAAGV